MSTVENGKGKGDVSSKPAPTNEKAAEEAASVGTTAEKARALNGSLSGLNNTEQPAWSDSEDSESDMKNLNNLSKAINTTNPSNSKAAEGENEKVYDPVKALNDKDGMINLNNLSDAIKEQTDNIKKHNDTLQTKIDQLQAASNNAVDNAKKNINGIAGLSGKAIEAINKELGNVYDTIKGSIGDLETQVQAYGDMLDQSGNNLPKPEPTGKREDKGKVDSDDKSEKDDTANRRTEDPKKQSMFRTMGNYLIGKKPTKTTTHNGAKGGSQSTGGYKSTPRTRKHRKTYRFTATPKSQTMKKRHRTHKKAKKQAKKQNKQRK